MNFEENFSNNNESSESSEIKKEDIELIRETITQKEIEVLDCKKELSEKIQEFISQKEKEGWNKFDFRSYYFGSIDFSSWKDKEFQHGHGSETDDNLAFFEWIASLDKDSYFVFSREDLSFD
jgi:hypothetical protein